MNGTILELNKLRIISDDDDVDDVIVNVVFTVVAVLVMADSLFYHTINSNQLMRLPYLGGKIIWYKIRLFTPHMYTIMGINKA